MSQLLRNRLNKMASDAVDKLDEVEARDMIEWTGDYHKDCNSLINEVKKLRRRLGDAEAREPDELTTRQAIIISAFTGTLCCNFGVYHKAVEEKMQRPVFTHEFGDREFAAEVKEVFREEFMSIIHKEQSDD